LNYSTFLSSESPSHLRNAAERGGEEGKIRSFLGEPQRPKVLHFAPESTPGEKREDLLFERECMEAANKRGRDRA
jgi:hypothetical protein